MDEEGTTRRNKEQDKTIATVRIKVKRLNVTSGDLPEMIKAVAKDFTKKFRCCPVLLLLPLALMKRRSCTCTEVFV